MTILVFQSKNPDFVLSVWIEGGVHFWHVVCVIVLELDFNHSKLLTTSTLFIILQHCVTIKIHHFVELQSVELKTLDCIIVMFVLISDVCFGITHDEIKLFDFFYRNRWMNISNLVHCREFYIPFNCFCSRSSALILPNKKLISIKQVNWCLIPVNYNNV